MQQTLCFEMPGRATRDITANIDAFVQASDVRTGVCHLFIRHTSASLLICENIDPAVRADLERWLGRAVPDGDPMFEHTEEGPDDMSGHIRSILTGVCLSVPVTEGTLNLGRYQGLYLYEHRTTGREREVVASLVSTAGSSQDNPRPSRAAD